MKNSIYCLCLLLLTGCPGGGSGGSSSGSSSSPSPAPVASTSGGNIKLTWTASVGSPDGYYVEQSLDGGSSYSQVQSVTVTNAVIYGVIHNTTYFFRVRAYNSGGGSPYSSVVTITP